MTNYENPMKLLYEVVSGRKNNPVENSYTCYLFKEGIDKILKKCGEECAETIIAAKGGDLNEAKNEICDLLYHLVVLMVELGIGYDEIEKILLERGQKIGNLKQMKSVDKTS